METPAWNIIYQDDGCVFGKEEETYVFFFNGNTYHLESIVYEPCLCIEASDRTSITIHNAFTIDELLNAIRDNGSIHMISGNDYDVPGVFTLIRKAIEMNRKDVDLSYVEEYRFFEYLKERGAVSLEAAVSPAEFGLKNCRMNSFIHSNKVERTGDGRFYLKGV